MNSALGTKIDGEDRPATIQEAYNELSQEAFAVWMRLLVAKDTELSKGRGALADLLGYSEGRSNAILRELKHKGYIEFQKSYRIGLPTLVKILRRGLVTGPSRIMKMGGDLPSQPSNPDGTNSLSSVLSYSVQSQETDEFADTLGDSDNMSGLGDFSSQIVSENGGSTNCTNLEMATKPGTVSTHEKSTKKTRKKRKKYVGLYGGYAGSEDGGAKTEPTPKKTPPLSLFKMKVSKHKEREKRVKQKAIRQEGRKTVGQNGKTGRRQKAKRKSTDLTKLDKKGKPLVKFECTDAERRAYLAILDRPKASPRRRQFVEKLEAQASRLYTRYRREFNNIFECTDRDRKYMREFGILCIRKCVTPTQVLVYWREHISNFADKGLNIVPPNFLSSSANVDTVACVLTEVTGGGKKRWKPDSFREEKASVHSYDDTSILHKKLREGLESAGFDTSAYPDRHLLSIQSAAKHVAKGYDIFVSSKMRGMVDWAAEHIFGGESDED